MSKQKKQRPAEQSAAPPPPVVVSAPAIQHGTPLTALLEIRDLLQQQCEFNAWLKDRLLANGTLV